MWTPPQWPGAFIAVAVAMLALLATMLGADAHAERAAAVAGGAIAGLFLAIGWTLRPLLWVIFPSLVAAALVALTAANFAAPDDRWLAAGAALSIAGAWVLGYHVIFTGWVARPVSGETTTFGHANASRRILILHHPGRSGFEGRLQRTLAETLAAHGARVEMTNAGSDPPSDASGYDLLVLGAPTYNFRPARPLLDALDRLSPLAAKPVALLLTGGGMTDAAMRHLRRRVEDRGGRVVEAIEIWTQRTNAERGGPADPDEIMRQAAVRLTL